MGIKDIPEMTGVSELKEISRRVIAFSIIGAFLVFLTAAVGYSLFGNSSQHFQTGKELMSTISSMFSGLVGAVVGFYFGTDASET